MTTKAALELELAMIRKRNEVLELNLKAVENRPYSETVAADAQAGREAQYAQVKQAHQLGLNVQAASFSASINQMIEFCNSWFTGVQGFSRDNFDGDCMLVVTELAEAVEADRKKAKDDHVPEYDGREAELADALVRILHIAGKYQLRLAPAFVAKMAVNLDRPFRHNKAY